MTITNPDLKSQVALFLTLQALLADAESAQWQRSRVISADEDDPGIRSLGEHGDPTFDAVSDPARMALRVAVMTAYDRLSAHYDELTEVAARLQTALDRWNGGL